MWISRSDNFSLSSNILGERGEEGGRGPPGGAGPVGPDGFKGLDGFRGMDGFAGRDGEYILIPYYPTYKHPL